MQRIAIDFHNTLADLTGEVLRRYNRDFVDHNKGVQYTKNDWTSWKVWDVTPITKDQFWAYVNEINETGANATLAPIEIDLARKVNHLFNFYPTCEVLTAMPHKHAKDVTAWLRTNAMPDLNVNTVGIPHAQGESKFTDFDFDIYIDDNPYMVGQTPRDKYLILIDHPWNRHVHPNKANEFRAENWDAIIRLCHSIQNLL